MNNKASYFLRLLLPGAVLSALELLGATTSASFPWNNRAVSIVSGTTWISPTASGTNQSALQVEGKAASGWTMQAPFWNTSDVQDGWHTLALAAPESATASVLVLNSASVVIHEGELAADEVWQAGVTHIVRNWVRIPEDTRLVMANGAVVKFCEGTGIINDGTLSALSTTLTALEDDTFAGDTNLDDKDSTPAENTYAVKNNGVLTAIDCQQFYATGDSEFHTTFIAEGAFRGCQEITRAEIPDDVTEIGGNAFQGCTNLQEITFNGKKTAVDDTAFGDCANLQKVNFPHGFPDKELKYTFGNASPMIYANVDPIPEKWNDYYVFGYKGNDNPGNYIPYPEEEGEPGQVLTWTEDGIIWQAIPVDEELDANSENAVQNQAVAATIGALEETDNALRGDMDALQTAAAKLAGADTAMRNDIAALQARDTALANADAAMRNDLHALQASHGDLVAAQAKLHSDITALQGNVTTLQGANSLIQKDIADLQKQETDLAAADASLQTALDALKTTVGGIMGIPQGKGEAGQFLAKTEDGVDWKTLEVAVDDTLDTESEHSVQNKAVAEAIHALRENERNLAMTDSELQKANDALKGAVDAQDAALAGTRSDLAALQTTLNGQQTAIAALQSAQADGSSTLETLQNTVATLASANQELTSKLNALLNVLENGGKESQVLTKGADGSYSWQDAGSHGAEVLTLHLEEGWNLVAMPGNAILDESTEAILRDVEIFTYDRTQQVYLHSDGLEPLASYWMRAPKPCAIHFKAAK
ncbi:MAG: leucine-rich repeat protein [Lentisphaeria bacterium]|nr:leucine-rich repeat protein [Lentisphaeria bacterium]